SRDGISVNDTRHNDSGGFAVIYTSPDLVEEVRVIVAAADAELGRGGGQVQMATRAGTNQFRGSVFYNNRNSALDASSWFNNFNAVPKNYYNRNQFGGRISGPIIKNKTFFFGLYDGQRFITRDTVVGNVLTATARQGIFRFFPGVQAAMRYRIIPLSICKVIRLRREMRRALSRSSASSEKIRFALGSIQVDGCKRRFH